MDGRKDDSILHSFDRMCWNTLCVRVCVREHGEDIFHPQPLKVAWATKWVTWDAPLRMRWRGRVLSVKRCLTASFPGPVGALPGWGIRQGSVQDGAEEKKNKKGRTEKPKRGREGARVIVFLFHSRTRGTCFGCDWTYMWGMKYIFFPLFTALLPHTSFPGIVKYQPHSCCSVAASLPPFQRAPR